MLAAALSEAQDAASLSQAQQNIFGPLNTEPKNLQMSQPLAQPQGAVRMEVGGCVLVWDWHAGGHAVLA